MLKPLKSKHYYKSISWQDLNSFRWPYIVNYGFVILTKEMLNTLVSYLKNKKVIDVGSGTGFISQHLRKRKIGVTLNDAVVEESNRYSLKYCLKPDLLGDVADLDFSTYDVIILSWPCYKSRHCEIVLDKMKKGQIIIYIGEWLGCTATKEFHNTLEDEKKFSHLENISDELNNGHVNFPTIHDSFYVYQKIE